MESYFILVFYIYSLFKFLLEQNAFFSCFSNSCFLILGPMKLVKNLLRFLHSPTAGCGKWPKREKKQRTEYLNFRATYFHKEKLKIQTYCQYRFELSGKSSIRSITHLPNLPTFNKITSTFPQLSKIMVQFRTLGSKYFYTGMQSEKSLTSQFSQENKCNK